MYAVSGHYGSFVFAFFLSCLGAMHPITLLSIENKTTFIRDARSGFYGVVPQVSRLIPELLINFLISVTSILILHFAVDWHGNFIS